MDGIRITLKSEAETRAFAQALAPNLKAGDTLLLEGPIGAGKTFFARALIQSRLQESGVHEDVPSPTFTLVQTYADDACDIWHADLYRLTGPDEIFELGLEDAFDTAICLIEWPDKLGALAPTNALSLSFATGPGETEREVLASGPAEWLRRVSHVQGVALAD